MRSAPALAKASRYGSQGSIIRWQSKGLSVSGLSAATTGGPKVMLGTKCPSMTSRWIQSAPAAAIARTSSPSLEKSDDKIEGAMITAFVTRRTPCDEIDGRWIGIHGRLPESQFGVRERLTGADGKPRFSREAFSGLLSLIARSCAATFRMRLLVNNLVPG